MFPYYLSASFQALMHKPVFEDKVFEKVDFTTQDFLPGEYDNCQFINCNMAAVRLDSSVFTECTFTSCNLSGASLHNASFRQVNFERCKLLGLRFDSCDKFLIEFSFDTCVMNLCSFFQLKIKKTVFRNCSLQEVDFAEADLTAAVFDGSDLHLAVFDHSNLEGVDFRTAVNYALDPTTNKIKKARFSLTGLPGLLARFDIDISH